MKILYYSYSFGFATTTFIRNETEFFNKEHQIKYLCTEYIAKETAPGYLKIIPFEENKIAKKSRWLLWNKDLVCSFKNKKYAKKLNAFIDDFNPDIIHCHFVYEALMLLDNLNDFDKKKIIVHFHGYDASKMLRKKSYVKRLKFYLKKRNIFTISCNKYFVDNLENNFNVNIFSKYILKYGINVNSLFQPTSINENKSANPIIFTQVAGFLEKKGHHYTFLAFKKYIQLFNDHSAQLIIIGNGSLKESLLKEVEELGLKNQVKFMGELRPTEIVEWLDKTDVFLHHSITDSEGDMEGIPNAIMEAMSMNLPVVSTIHSGIPELVENGVNGYLVNEKVVDCYTMKMKEATKMGKLPINRLKITNEYNMDIHNELLRKFYVDCINS